MVIRAALFDVDGTLLDSSAFHVEAWRRAFSDFGIEVAVHAIAQQMGNGGDRVVKALCTPEQAAKFSKRLIERHVEIFSRDYLPRVQPFPGVVELFQRLRHEGVRISLASSAQEWERDRHIEILGVAHLLDHATSGEAAETTKPSPDIFQAALCGLGDVAPEEAVAIGDSPYDAEAARRGGFWCFGVLSGGFSKQRLLQAGAHRVFSDIADLLEDSKRWSFSSLAQRPPSPAGSDLALCGLQGARSMEELQKTQEYPAERERRGMQQAYEGEERRKRANVEQPIENPEAPRLSGNGEDRTGRR
jgi:HAD superfamily hydrolase (TIGR01509 family)